MTLEDAIKTLQHIYSYANPNNLEKLDYIISILKKLKSDGITNPLETDFSSLKNNQLIK